MTTHAQRLAALGRVPREVLDVLTAAETPLKAYALLWRLQAQRGRQTPPSTVYRALSALIDAGLVHRIESLAAYTPCAGPGVAHDPVFLICERCAQVREVDLGPTREHVETRVAAAGFRVRRLNFIVHGLCAACAGKAALR
jgi:Fur family zinc uptake transcriptional regulator